MRYLTFIGHFPSANSVQFRATANAASNAGGVVTINITPALNWAGGQNQNLNNPIAAGMQITWPAITQMRGYFRRRCSLLGYASIARTITVRYS